MLDVIDSCSGFVVKCHQHFENCINSEIMDLAERNLQCPNTD